MGLQQQSHRRESVADHRGLPIPLESGEQDESHARGAVGGFYVYDPGADTQTGQGGVLWVGGLKNVAKLQLTLTNTKLVPNNQVDDLVVFNVATPIPAPARRLCVQPATAYNGSPVAAWFDGANCYLKAIVAGATGFIWNNAYYVTPDKSTQCVPGTGWYDSANCYFMAKPAGGYLANDTFSRSGRLWQQLLARHVRQQNAGLPGEGRSVGDALEYNNAWYCLRRCTRVRTVRMTARIATS